MLVRIDRHGFVVQRVGAALSDQDIVHHPRVAQQRGLPQLAVGVLGAGRGKRAASQL